MKYIVELDKYELNILKDIVKKDYEETKKNCKYKTGFDRDILEDSSFKLLLLLGKLDNIVPVADKITETCKKENVVCLGE